jgi:hypothetical protein
LLPGEESSLVVLPDSREVLYFSVRSPRWVSHICIVDVSLETEATVAINLSLVDPDEVESGTTADVSSLRDVPANLKENSF